MPCSNSRMSHPPAIARRSRDPSASGQISERVNGAVESSCFRLAPGGDIRTWIAHGNSLVGPTVATRCEIRDFCTVVANRQTLHARSFVVETGRGRPVIDDRAGPRPLFALFCFCLRLIFRPQSGSVPPHAAAPPEPECAKAQLRSLEGRQRKA